MGPPRHDLTRSPGHLKTKADISSSERITTHKYHVSPHPTNIYGLKHQVGSSAAWPSIPWPLRGSGRYPTLGTTEPRGNRGRGPLPPSTIGRGHYSVHIQQSPPGTLQGPLPIASTWAVLLHTAPLGSFLARIKTRSETTSWLRIH